MQIRHPGLALLLLLLSPPATAEPIAPVSVDTLGVIHAVDPDSERVAVEPDTMYIASEENPLLLDMITVSARRVSRVAGADRVELDEELVQTRDGGTVADLVALLPSTKLTVNSRGESLFMIRGSSERHVRIELDGIPLTIPWDERADLSMLPLLAVETVEAHRGVRSVLDPPNALAGTVELSTREQVLQGSSSRIGASIGEVDAWRVQGIHLRRHGDWALTVAAGHRTRDGFLVPEDASVGLHQDPSRRLRLNSQSEQSSALLKLRRDFAGDGGWHLLAQVSRGEKGVPPEEHLADPRFWIYPEMRRLLLGARLQTPADRTWRLDTSASFDAFEQDIDSYPDRDYDQPDGFEEDRDRTGFWRARVERGLGGATVVRARGTVRYASHRERTDDVPAELHFAQALFGGAAEIEHAFEGDLRLRGGAGYEGATTPESGDKPRRDADHELALHAAVEGHFSGDGTWHLNASRRPRMPSLRELYSGALGSFLPNDDLRPERQDAVEAGMSWSASRWNLSANAFAQQIDGAIERITTPGGLRQRVNLDEVRNVGIELGSVVKPARGIAFDVQATWLHSRARDAQGNFDRRVEDRPEWLATLAGTWTHRSGVRLRAELDGIGRRWSLDQRKTDPDEPFTALDPTARLNLRLSWRHFGEVGGYAGTEWYVRVDNVLDEETFSQLGLVESGRTVMTGIRIDFDR